MHMSIQYGEMSSSVAAMEEPEEEQQQKDATNTNTNIIPYSSRQKWCITEYLYSYNGFWFLLPYLEATLRLLHNTNNGTLNLHSHDVILASFPKTGTTWLKALLHTIIHRPQPHPHPPTLLTTTHPHNLVRSMETDLFLLDHHQDPTTQLIQGPGGTRIMATHLPHQIIGGALTSSGCKVVYVTRNPKDALISLWHFVNKSPMFEVDPWDWDTAVDQFCEGSVPFGPYYDHVLKYREESIRRPDKVLFVTYEDLKEDTKKHVARIADFLGCPLEREGEAEEIVKLCSLETLRSLEVNQSKEIPYGGFPIPFDSFFRKGQVGDYKNYLTHTMVGKIDDLTRNMFYQRGFEYGI
ncbi:cytosolic sulfotransferase 5-like [Andrographis paniculata]|uniref:cytosolic sulfotransferase 5-like n=1 Tax=Andrographis paniculata TaxID=175694 RepID=UPI0021E78674|nr:cytosolic sulfotransferase 5-like [Andrographis paniculata]